MPNHVANSVIATGPEEEIERLLTMCFRPQDDEAEEGDRTDLGPDFQSIIPIDETSTEAGGGFRAAEDLRIRHWGTKWDAYDCAIVDRQTGCVHFEFHTASDLPEPIYRKLGTVFPALRFDVAAIDPGAWWAVTASICGSDAVFDENADMAMVFERVFKAPLETVLQPEA